MLKKIISNILIFAILFVDPAFCGKNGLIRSKSFSDPDESRRSIPLKKELYRPRSKSLPANLKKFSKNVPSLINSDLLLPKIEKTVPLGSGIILPYVEKPEDCSNSPSTSTISTTTITTSSTESSPREGESSTSKKSSTESSPSKPSEGNKDVPNLQFDEEKTLSQGTTNWGEKEPVLGLSVEQEKEHLNKSPLLEISTAVLASQGLEKEPGVNAGPKTQNEEVLQKKEDEKTIASLSEPVIETLEKFEEKIESPRPPVVEEKQPIENPISLNVTQEMMISDQIVTENNSSETPSVIISTPTVLSVSGPSSLEKGQSSSSRRNSSNASSDVEVLIQDLPKVFDEKVSELMGSNKSGDSSSLSESKNLVNSNNEISSVSENLNSSQNSTVNQEEKKENASVDAGQEQGRVLSFLNMLKNNKKEREEKQKHHLQGDTEEIEIKGNIQNDINLEENSGLDEKTSLLSNKRSFKGKKGNLNKEWHKTGTTTEEELPFSKSSGTFKSHHFDNDIRIEKKKKKKTPKCAQDWLLLYAYPGTDGVENLESMGADHLEQNNNSLKSFEMISFSEAEDGYSDVESGDGKSYFKRGKKGRSGDFQIPFSNKFSAGKTSLSINGEDERVFLEEKKKPLPKLVPEFLKSSPISTEKEDDLSDCRVSLENDDSDKAPMILQTTRQSKFSQLLNRLPEEDQGMLSYLKKVPWLTLAAFLISAGEAIAMNVVYNGGLVYLRDAHHSAALWLYFKSELELLSCAYIIPSVLLDAFPRNLKSLTTSATYLAGEKIDKTRIILTLATSILPSLLEASYLVVFEKYLMNRMHIHGLDNQFAISAMVLSLFRFTDSMISNGSALWELQDDFEEWVETSSLLVAKKLRPYFIHPPLVSDRDDLIALHQNRLENFSQSLFRRSQEEINDIYTSIRDVKATIQTELPELEEDLLNRAEDFFVRRYLLALGEEKRVSEQKIFSSWRETIGIGTVLTLGTPYRLLAMEFIWETAFGLVLPPLASKVLGWIVGSFAFFVQTALEGKALKKYSYEYLGDQGPEGHWSHFKFRAILKSICSWQGCVFAGPLIVLCLQICDLWFSSTWGMLASPFFIFPEYALLTNSFNNSYNKQAGSYALDWYTQNILEKRLGKELENDYKVDYIWRRINKEKNLLKTLPAFDLDVLQKTLNPSEKEGVINI